MNLEEFSDIEDVTDPEVFTRVLIHLEAIQEEDDKFMQILISRKDLMSITWEQPWYQRYHGLTRKLNVTDENETISFRTDTISKIESEKILENWDRLRKLLRLPDRLISFARWRNKTNVRNSKGPEEFARRFVTAFLAQGLERSIHQVYKHIVTHFGCPNKGGTYSKLEEKMIAICLYHCPKNAVPYLSVLLSREPRGLYKRINYMSNGYPEKKKLKWTLELATKFVHLLTKQCGKPLKKLKNKRIDKSVWLNLEKDMEQRYNYLQKFWHRTLHVQLFVKVDVKLKKLQRKIFKEIKKYPYQVWSDIRWKEIVKGFPDGFSHVFLYDLSYRLIKSCDNFLKVPLDELIKYGITRLKELRNRRLKTLAFDENLNLVIVKHPNKL